MERVKAAGLMLLVVCALGALTASAASAVEFLPDETGATVESANATFTAPNNGTVVCEKTVVQGKTQAKGEAAKIRASALVKYEKCTAFGVKATVTEACTGAFGRITAVTEKEVTVSLETGCEIVVTTSTCKLTAVGLQQLAGKWVNGAKASTLTLKEQPVTVTTSPAKGSICGEGGNGKESGTFSAFQTASPMEPITIK